MEITHGALPPPNPLANAPAIGSTFDAKPKADFQSASNGLEPKLAWARSSHGNGLSFASGGIWSLNMGGRTSRDAALASRVSNDMATSNSPIATLLLNLTTQAIGTGLTLSSKPRASELNITPEEARDLSNQIESKWAAWASNPLEVDVAGRHDLHSLAGAAFRSYLLNGEALAVLDWASLPGSRTKTKICLLDPDQLDRSFTRAEAHGNAIQGVVFDKRGRVAGYMLRELPLGAVNLAPQATFVPAYTSWGRAKVLHLFTADDPRQVRGLSPLIGALSPAQEESTLAEFTLGQALIQASFTTTIESSLPTPVAFDALTVDDRKGGILPSMDEWLNTHQAFYEGAKIKPQVGTITHLAPGDKLVQHESKSPNNTFEPFDRSLLRKIAKAAGASAEDLTGNFADTNFAASRLAAALPHSINLRRRKDIAERFYRGVFEAWLEESIQTGAIKLPKGAADFYEAKDAFCNAKFLGSGMVSADPLKTANTQIRRLENGLTTLTEIAAEDGVDLEARMETLLAEKAYLESIGLTHPFWVAQEQKKVKAA